MPPQLRPNQVYLAEYVVERLAQIGIKRAFGVPGDFNLELLDFFEAKPDKVEFIGCCNELNASYAADGYARVSPAKMGCLITTFGVGELSSMNGQAGAYAERVPIIHIVGVPSTKLSKVGAVLHHTLGDGSTFVSLCLTLDSRRARFLDVEDVVLVDNPVDLGRLLISTIYRIRRLPKGR